MTQQQFVDYIKWMLAPVDKTNRYHKEYIKYGCGLVYAQQLASYPNYTSGEMETYAKLYTGQTVTLDSTTNRYYTTLPAAIVSIPKVTSGVLNINTQQGGDLDFVPTTEQEVFFADGSAAHTIDTTIGYWLQNTKIWYNDGMTAAIAAAGVRMLVLPRFEAFDSTDTINIPGASDMDFIAKVVSILAPTAPVDLKSNNA